MERIKTIGLIITLIMIFLGCEKVKDPDDPYTVYVAGLEAIEGLDEDQGPLVMHINPASFAVTADKTVIASNAWGDHNIAYAGTGAYNSCDGSYAMYFDISVDEGPYGRYLFNFTRNP